MYNDPKPTDIILHQQSRTLEVVFDSGESFQLPWEYLRVYSPSKEVRARRGKDRVIITGKSDVSLTDIKQIGQYAVKLYFDDGHNSGLYDWTYLHELGTNQEAYWQDYLVRAEALKE